MRNARLEVYTNGRDNRHQDNIALLCLEHCRRIGYKNYADMFTAAYSSYDSALPEIALQLFFVRNTCQRFLQKLLIEYREDFDYVIRHIDRYTDDFVLEFPQDSERKIILYEIKGEDAEAEKALDYLESITPRERAVSIINILNQFLIKTQNDFYFDQAAARLFHYFKKTIETIDRKELTEEVQALVETIWKSGH